MQMAFNKTRMGFKMFKKNTMAALTVVLATVSVQAFAKPVIEMSMVAQKEIRVTEGGQSVVKTVPATTVDAGDIVTYTIHYKNTGDALAKDVKTTDPIPAGMVYINGSAGGAGSDVTFTTDPLSTPNKTYKKADALVVNVTVDGVVNQVKAQASDYTAIQWVISQVLPGQGGDLSFSAKAQ